ncbi:MAG: leucyl aminopeptidase [Alphaproteobacteria bacterium]|nr:leucyl aminopeptidase [Alphaproteobacteria bacterium]MCB9975295.1 leucyl aminopeptidase [Rhodospirillales bacterium]
MTLDITFSKTTKKKAEALVLGVYEKRALAFPQGALEENLHSLAARMMEKSRNFKGKPGQSLVSLMPEGEAYDYLVLIGLGDGAKLDALEAEKAGGRLSALLTDKSIKSAEFIVDDALENKARVAASFGVGARLRSYSFEIYKSEKKDDEKVQKPEKLNICVSADKEAGKLFKREADVMKGVFLARDFVNEPPNVLYPYAYANRILEALKPLGVEIEILDDKKLLKHGFGALMAVGQGSAHPPCLVVMRWNGLERESMDAPLALVGKGVTFDTGGVSLKPGLGMDEMKMDMGGSAAVVGTMMALAQRKAQVDVVGVVGLVENMLSDRAYRPADILKSYSGKTIEVLNTDAEGRLVLADALSYVQKLYKPKAIIDLATLTGAMIVALGHELCGTFANNDDLWAELQEASKITGEKLWRMPLEEEFKKEMESETADLQNIAKSGRNAGACTAAGFLWHFIEGDTPWAHLDIAGTAWIKKDRETTPKFGTGFGVRLLDRWIADHYE